MHGDGANESLEDGIRDDLVDGVNVADIDCTMYPIFDCVGNAHAVLFILALSNRATYLIIAGAMDALSAAAIGALTGVTMDTVMYINIEVFADEAISHCASTPSTTITRIEPLIYITWFNQCILSQLRQTYAEHRVCGWSCRHWHHRHVSNDVAASWRPPFIDIGVFMY